VKELAIYGAGGFGREVAWLVEDLKEFSVVAFVEDGPPKPRMLSSKPVLTYDQLRLNYPHAEVAVAVGNPKTRRAMVERWSGNGFSFPSIVSLDARMSGSVKLAWGVIICSGSILTVDISLGAHVHVNLDCTVGHDVSIGDYSTLAPGVHVSGNVRIGEGVYIGTGAAIINGSEDHPLVIGAGSVIAAGACVTTAVEADTLYAGVPAIMKKRYPPRVSV
jgi:sugar O-acyltransferase (sialic acid O-acetyltransferase NeuD family)